MNISFEKKCYRRKSGDSIFWSSFLIQQFWTMFRRARLKVFLQICHQKSKRSWLLMICIMTTVPACATSQTLETQSAAISESDNFCAALTDSPYRNSEDENKIVSPPIPENLHSALCNPKVFLLQWEAGGVAYTER